MGALIQAFIPVVIALLAFFFLKEKVSGTQQFSILISVAGVALVSYFAKRDTSSSNPLLGNSLMLVAVISWAVYTVISKKLADYDVLKVTCYSTYIGTAFLIPFVVAELWHKPFPHISAVGWISVIYLGVVASALSYFLYNQSLKLLSASLAGIFINLDPVVGAALAIIFLHEAVTAPLVAGSVMVLAGTWISARKAE
jgi:drug/metabolite transporter (DMT)-like permease